MAEASELRLVRCPKCGNLLTELPDISVYRCGGCDAVLRAKEKGPLNDGLLEKLEDERGKGVFEKGGVSIGNTSETEREIDGFEFQMTKERVFQEKVVNSSISSSLRTENKDVLVNSDRIRRGERLNSRTDQSSNFSFYDDEYRRSSKVPIDNYFRGNDHELGINRPEFVNSSLENELEEIRPPIGHLRSSRPIMDQWSTRRNGSAAFHGAENGRLATFSYPDEGTSTYRTSTYRRGSSYRYGGQMRNRDESNGLTTVENLENDRTELLRKLDELKDQLSRSCDVAEKPKEGVALDRRMAPPPPDIYAAPSYNVNPHSLGRDKHTPRRPYFSYNHGSVPYVNDHALDMQDFYPSREVPNEFLGYEDVYQPQMFGRPPHRYSQPSYHGRFPQQHMHFHQNLPNETLFHQPACSCFHCYKQNRKPPVFSNQRLPHEPTNPPFYQHVNPVMYGARGYGYESSNPPQPPSRDHPRHTRSSSELDSDTSGFGHRRPRRVVVASGSGRVCYPIAGGAPFITCCNCFELLKLPRKLMAMGNKQWKMICGACSSVILFELENKGLVVSVPEQIKQDNGSRETSNENLQTSQGCSNIGATNSCFEDYDNSGYDFLLKNAEPELNSRDQGSNLSESEKRQEPKKRQNPLSSSSSFSEDERSPDSVIVLKDVSNSSALPLPDSPLQEDPDYSFSDNVMSKYEKGSKSKRIDQEKVILDKAASRQNSVKDASTATEMEVSYNDFLNSGVSQNSMEVSKEEGRLRINKGGESFFAGLIKKRFKEFSRSSQSMENGRSNVYVNGQLIPDRVVKKAEKLAGPIQPGEYWYDSRAGFWGVMGQPCLGIIPPYIEEFNYPLPDNCAAGNTGVFVNGRELHQKDLDLLVGRGLPITRNKSYLIEISGRVLDKDTGEELDCLGKLAPTVEKAKHGFGMKVPRAVV